jgi:hypothetical protein
MILSQTNLLIRTGLQKLPNCTLFVVFLKNPYLIVKPLSNTVVGEKRYCHSRIPESSARQQQKMIFQRMEFLPKVVGALGLLVRKLTINGGVTNLLSNNT